MLVPDNAADIAEVIRAGVPVTAWGRGHSTHGQSLVDGGVVVDMAGLSSVQRVEPGYAVVDAGASWRTVLEATLPLGLTPPVLTDFLDLSVGGTLSLGGIGGTSHRHGAQVDFVNRLGDEEAFLATLSRRVQPRPWCTVFLPESAYDPAGLLNRGQGIFP